MNFWRGSAAHVREERWVPWIAGLALLLGVMRFFGLDRHSLWYDEVVTVQLIRNPLDALAAGRFYDGGNPQGFWVILKAWSEVFGMNAAALRACNAFFGLLAILAMPMLVMRLTNSRIVSAFSMLLLALAPLHWGLSQELRGYAPAILFVILACRFLWDFCERPTLFSVVGYLLFVLAGLYCNYYVGLVVAGFTLYLMLEKRIFKHFVPWLVLQVVAAIGFVPALQLFVKQLGMRAGNTLDSGNSLLHLVVTPFTLFFGRYLVWKDDGVHWFVPVAALLAAALLYLCWTGIRSPAVGQGARSVRWRFTAATMFAPIAIPLVLAALFHMQSWDDRKASLWLPFYCLLLAQGCAVLWIKRRRWWVLVLVGLAALVGIAGVQWRAKDDWRAALQYVKSDLNARGPLIVLPDYETASVTHYVRQWSAPGVLGNRIVTFDVARKGWVETDFHGFLRDAVPLSTPQVVNILSDPATLLVTEQRNAVPIAKQSEALQCLLSRSKPLKTWGSLEVRRLEPGACLPR